MNWQVTPVATIYAAAVIVSLVGAGIAWRHRSSRAARLLALGLLCGTVWALGYLLGFFNTDLTWKKHMIRIEYLGIVGGAYCFFLFAMAYTSFERWLNRTTVIVLGILPLLTYLQALTHDLHPFLYQSFKLVTVNGLVVTEKSYGIGFYLYVANGYLLVFGASILLLSDVVRHPQMFRGQAILLVLAALIPMGINATYVFGINPFRPYDPSSVAFVLSCVLVLIGMMRFRLLDLVPIAHDLVFQNVPSGVIVINSEGRILELNPAAEQILGRTVNTVVGKSALEVFPEHQGLIRQFRDVTEIRTQIEMGTAKRIYDMQIAPLRGRSGAGDVIGRVILLNDITEREQLIAELDAYARTVAHDLKTPINAIMGYADMLEQQMDKHKALEETRLAKAIVRSSAKMDSIINSLLLLAELRRLEDIETKAVDMKAVVADTLHRLEHRIKELDAKVTQPDKWPEGVISFAPWIEEIWANYIGNALKYGGTPPHVELGATLLPDGKVRFWVKDNGKGMTPEERERLFTVFSRLAQHKGTEGHGLGLSIVHNIAERLGGEVGVESTPGEGSTFYFVLPVQAAAKAEKPAA